MSILCIFFWRASAQLYGVSLQNLTEGLHPGVAQHVDADYRRNQGQGWLVRTNADCLRSAWLILLSLAGNKAYVLNRFHTRKKAGFNPNHRCSPSQFWSEQRAWANGSCPAVISEHERFPPLDAEPIQTLPCCVISRPTSPWILFKCRQMQFSLRNPFPFADLMHQL